MAASTSSAVASPSSTMRWISESIANWIRLTRKPGFSRQTTATWSMAATKSRAHLTRSGGVKDAMITSTTGTMCAGVM